MNSFFGIKKSMLVACCLLGFSGCANVGQIADAGVNISQAMGYSPEQLNNGIKEALVLSVTRASDALSVNGAYGNMLQRALLCRPRYKILPRTCASLAWEGISIILKSS